MYQISPDCQVLGLRKEVLLPIGRFGFDVAGLRELFSNAKKTILNQ
jgi:hypothetical protein